VADANTTGLYNRVSGFDVNQESGAPNKNFPLIICVPYDFVEPAMLGLCKSKGVDRNIKNVLVLTGACMGFLFELKN
jgi:hypothetical protein